MDYGNIVDREGIMEMKTGSLSHSLARVTSCVILIVSVYAAFCWLIPAGIMAKIIILSSESVAGEIFGIDLIDWALTVAYFVAGCAAVLVAVAQVILIKLINNR